MISIVDKNILGKEFSEGNKLLDLNADFYKGKKMSEESVLKIIKKANQLNVVGKNIVQLLKDKGYIKLTQTIDNIPFAHIIL